jgi:acyl-CoA synthetase (AMP-forming)/AMP-acid ligase II
MTSTPPGKLLDQLRRHAADAPERIAVREIATGRAITYAQLHDAATRFAAMLQQRLPAGSVVVLRCPNRCDYHVAFFATLHGGIVIFPVPPEINPREFAALAAKAEAAAVIDEKLNIRLLDADAPIVTHGRDGLLLQSSGTTGLPKIVHRDAQSLDAVAAQMADACDMHADDRILSCVPLCHSYGLEHGLLAPIFAGATVNLADGFDLSIVRNTLAHESITHFPAVPSVYEMLANVADDGGRFPSLRVAYSAGGPLPISLYEKLATRGLRVSQLYGATEIGSVTFTRADDSHFAHGAVGRAMAGVELHLDADGQLRVRAKSMMTGYIGDASPLTPDGFFPTGDLARIDEHGNLFITGRLKLLIDVGGLKVNPLEVEQTIEEHPAVSACVVVPMRLSETVFRLKAVVTPADPAQPPSSDELRKFTRERLTIHKVPRVFELRATLPRSATGKILRHLLVESA